MVAQERGLELEPGVFAGNELARGQLVVKAGGNGFEVGPAEVVQVRITQNLVQVAAGLLRVPRGHNHSAYLLHLRRRVAKARQGGAGQPAAGRLVALVGVQKAGIVVERRRAQQKQGLGIRHAFGSGQVGGHSGHVKGMVQAVVVERGRKAAPQLVHNKLFGG
ncbi:hypothetical protein BEN47_14840 [Hymenobacter lapidarius]|uniref:Uncharacterized protein n=1 Tax=Hymenobacter lapidarius TaxID=1908237 RepID=A0A1G1T3N7_9BACT|nr:hypothetical protein BEN47_14840 [Hymenobacter lapidarius]